VESIVRQLEEDGGLERRGRSGGVEMRKETKSSGRDRITAGEAIAWLERNAKRRNIEAMARYGIPSTNAVGVTVGEVKAYARRIGRDHELALQLWPSGIYEARILAAFVGESAKVTGRLMDSWAADFDSWAIVDTVCFHLFDRAPPAWKKVHGWAGARAEFRKRAAFALLWGLAVHDKAAADAKFRACLPLIEKASRDDRLYVKKGIDMALRAVGKRNAKLRAAAREVAGRLRASDHPAQAFIGRSTLRAL
jgi:3-methyladenine DNA glycosylase AlkD